MSVAELAIFELARTRSIVESLSRSIGDSLGACFDAQVAINKNATIVHHLEDAYKMTYGEAEWGDERVFFDHHDGDAGAYLAAICHHCLAAHNAIQDRKLARKQYGIAKRRVSVMGSRMLKAMP